MVWRVPEIIPQFDVKKAANPFMNSKSIVSFTVSAVVFGILLVFNNEK